MLPDPLEDDSLPLSDLAVDSLFACWLFEPDPPPELLWLEPEPIEVVPEVGLAAEAVGAGVVAVHAAIVSMETRVKNARFMVY